ncbi:hypothetical protein PENTCL1PPCAC_27247, partial [Pristionchus entomophagus]
QMAGRKRQLSETRDESPPPKRRAKTPKTPSTAGVAASTKKEWEETDERLLAITKSIMFAIGDSIEPIECNTRMLLGLMQQQIRLIIDAAMKRANSDGRDAVTLRDLFMHFARHKMVLGRLLHHAKAAHLVFSLSRHTKDEEEEEKEEDGVPHEAEILDHGEEEGSSSDEQVGPLAVRASKSSTYYQLEAAIDSLQGGFRSSDLTDPSFVDLTRQARDRRMATRVKRLREDVYKQFSEARQATYVSRVRQKKFNGILEGALFISWLGLPPLDNVLTYVISWLAKEIVTQVVDDAYMCMLREMSSGTTKRRGAAASRLTVNHYEEALRKNLGWRTKSDVLFGYIAPRE